jgi:inorganic triphosphatase YgiF
MPGAQESEPGRPEVELKLRAQPEDLDKLRRHFTARGLTPDEQHVVTGYYDTPELALAGSGIALRVRRDGARLVQSLKARARAAAGATMGAAARGEWEAPVSGDQPELARLDDAADRLVPEHLRPALRRIFDTDIRRTRFDLALGEGTAVEVAVDEGRVATDLASRPIAEIELELKAEEPKPGDAGRLYELALELQRVADLQLATESKADLGYGLAGAEPPAAAKAASPALPPLVSAVEGFRIIMRGCIGHLLENEQPARSADPVEGVHQMRVAARRVRSAMKLFRPLLASAESGWIADELKWLGNELGRVHDWDVFADGTLAALRQEAPDVAAALAGPAAAWRAAAHESLAASLDAPRYTTLLLTLGAWVEADRWCADAGRRQRRRLESPLDAVAGRLLDGLERPVREAGRDVGELDDAERHELRKALKKLRYGVEFLGELYPRRAVRRYRRPMQRLQRRLGDLNDLVAAAALADQLRREAEAAAAEARAIFGRRLARRVVKLEGRWRRFAEAAPFW